MTGGSGDTPIWKKNPNSQMKCIKTKCSHDAGYQMRMMQIGKIKYNAYAELNVIYKVLSWLLVLYIYIYRLNAVWGDGYTYTAPHHHCCTLSLTTSLGYFIHLGDDAQAYQYISISLRWRERGGKKKPYCKK